MPSLSSGTLLCFFLTFDVLFILDEDVTFFFPFFGEDKVLPFFPLIGGGEISIAPLMGDLEILPLELCSAKPLRLPSNEGDLENEDLPRPLIGETILRPLGDGDLENFLPVFFPLLRLFCGMGERDLDLDLEKDL